MDCDARRDCPVVVKALPAGVVSRGVSLPDWACGRWGIVPDPATDRWRPGAVGPLGCSSDYL